MLWIHRTTNWEPGKGWLPASHLLESHAMWLSLKYKLMTSKWRVGTNAGELGLWLDRTGCSSTTSKIFQSPKIYWALTGHWHCVKFKNKLLTLAWSWNQYLLFCLLISSFVKWHDNNRTHFTGQWRLSGFIIVEVPWMVSGTGQALNKPKLPVIIISHMSLLSRWTQMYEK